MECSRHRSSLCNGQELESFPEWSWLMNELDIIQNCQVPALMMPSHTVSYYTSGTKAGISDFILTDHLGLWVDSTEGQENEVVRVAHPNPRSLNKPLRFLNSDTGPVLVTVLVGIMLDEYFFKIKY